MPPIQTTYSTSTFETIYSIDSKAAESDKLGRLAQAYKSQSVGYSKLMNINIYGYIKAEVQMSSVTESSERAAMQQRFGNIRNSLIQMGVPGDKIWVGGVAFSTKWGGQIDISVKEVNLSPNILPLYPPYVPSGDPQNSSDGKEQWLDSEGTLKNDVIKSVLAIEIELSLKEGGYFKTKPPISAKASIKSDGTIELGAEWTPVVEEVKFLTVGGTVEEVKFKVSVEGGAEFKIDDKRIHTELNAAIKASLSAILVTPVTKKKIPVDMSIGIGIDGKVAPGLQFTTRW